MRRRACNSRLLSLAFILFLTLAPSVATKSYSFDSSKIFFAGDSSTTYCRESTSGPDVYQASLFSRLQVSPPTGFTTEPEQEIVSQSPCSISHPGVNGYGALKILDWNTECTDASGSSVCSWSCYDCPDPECEIHRSSILFGGEADWCCCASRRACTDQSDARYVIFNLLPNDLFQLSKFYGSDVDRVVEEAKSLTGYTTAQGRTVIWLTFYPIGYGSLGNGERGCSDVLSCLFAANSNAEYFYQEFIPWIADQPDVYLIDFFGYIKETYAPNPKGFIDTYGYDGLHLKPGGHQIYYDFVFSRLSALLAEINDRDGDGIPDTTDNCPDLVNTDQLDMDSDGRGNVCDNCWQAMNPDQLDSNENCPEPPYITDPLCGDACEMQQTCEGYCGGQSMGGCWCDVLCVHYGDCCPDYDEWCAPSCEGICGQQHSSGCWCDDLCEQYGDCCPDKCDWCPCIAPDSCEGRCNGSAPAGCWCDAACVNFGDCCPNTCDICGYCAP